MCSADIFSVYFLPSNLIRDILTAHNGAHNIRIITFDGENDALRITYLFLFLVFPLFTQAIFIQIVFSSEIVYSLEMFSTHKMCYEWPFYRIRWFSTHSVLILKYSHEKFNKSHFVGNYNKRKKSTKIKIQKSIFKKSTQTDFPKFQTKNKYILRKATTSHSICWCVQPTIYSTVSLFCI